MIATLQQAFEQRSGKLNKIEQLKEQRTPKEAFEQIEQYAKAGYDAIAEADLNFFLKCFGIFDRPKTPKKFMMRIRVPGGQLNAQQADVIGTIAKEFGQDYIDISTRAQIVLRFIRIEDIPQILKRIEDVGLTTFHTGVDNFRNMLNDPLDGVAYDNILPSQPLLEKMQALFLDNWEWVAAMPRKFNTGVCGSLSNRNNIFGQDFSFVLAQKEGVYGYNVYLGGRVGMIAKKADLFVKDEEEAIKLFQAVIELYRDYGFKDNRNKNRLHFLIEAVGMQSFCDAIREKAAYDFLRAGETKTELDDSFPQQGKVAQKDGAFSVFATVPSGIFTGSSLIDAARLAANYGSDAIRFTVEQSLYFLGVLPKQVDALLKEPFFATYQSVASPYFQNLVACAGQEHCPFGVIENKPDAINMANYLDEVVPLDGGSVGMYWSACVKGCGIHGVGDIGFEGCKAKVDGKSVPGVHISIGGKLTGEGQEGRSILKAVPLDDAKKHVAVLMRFYQQQCRENERFSAFYDRTLAQLSSGAIGFIVQLQTFLEEHVLKPMPMFEKVMPCGGVESLEVYALGKVLYNHVSDDKPYDKEGELLADVSAHYYALGSSSDIAKNRLYMLINMMLDNTKAQQMSFSQLATTLKQPLQEI